MTPKNVNIKWTCKKLFGGLRLRVHVLYTACSVDWNNLHIEVQNILNPSFCPVYVGSMVGGGKEVRQKEKMEFFSHLAWSLCGFRFLWFMSATGVSVGIWSVCENASWRRAQGEEKQNNAGEGGFQENDGRSKD